MNINFKKIYDQIMKFNNIRVGVIGDFFLDKYVYGYNRGMSSSSGISIFKEKEEMITLGGAGNVVNNLIKLGAKVTCFSAIGNDDNGRYIIDYVSKNGVAPKSLVYSDNNTNVKTRFLIEEKEVFRIDKEHKKLNEQQLVQSLEVWIEDEFKNLDIIIISDYSLGVCTNTICKKVICEAEKFGIKVIVDSRCFELNKFKGVNYIVPNINEFNKIIEDNKLSSLDDEIKSIYNIIDKYDIKDGVILTKGNKGMIGVKSKENIKIPEYKVNVIDTVGAGDTVISLLALGLNININFFELMYLLNLGGAISVTQKGTYALSRERLYIELLEVIKKLDYKNKIVQQDELENICKLYKNLNKRIVFTNGCFDLVHSGHTEYLYKSKKLGDVLVLALNSDDSVRRLKGERRPINSQEERSTLLASLEPLDFITIFEEDTPRNLLKRLRPNILVKGGDYKIEDLDGVEFVEDIILMDYIENKSTTEIIQKIVNINNYEENKDGK